MSLIYHPNPALSDALKATKKCGGCGSCHACKALDSLLRRSY